MKEIALEAVVENLPKVTAFVDAALEEYGCSMKAQMQIDIAIDEIFSNIAQYAYAPHTGEAAVRIDFDESSRTASITFIDSGAAFNPLERAAPDVTLPAEERQIGGLGILLVRKTMDAVEYRRAGNQNFLTIQKGI